MPGSKTEHFVGFKGRFFIPEAGRRVEMEGVLILVRENSWKVRDLVFLFVDGRRLEKAISLAAQFPGGGIPPSGPNVVDSVREWYEKPQIRRTTFFFLGVLSLKAIPKLLIGVGAVMALVYAAMQKWGKRNAA